MMKRMISLTLSVFLLLTVFAGCSKNAISEKEDTKTSHIEEEHDNKDDFIPSRIEEGNANTGNANYQENTNSDMNAMMPDTSKAELYTVLSNENPKQGETVTAEIRIKNVPRFSTIDLIFTFDASEVDVEYTKGSSIEGYYGDVNTFEEGSIRYGGFVLTTYDIADESLLTFEITPKKDISKVVIDITPKGLHCSLDENGKTIVEKTDTLQFSPINIELD